jgi:hypothetical protein
MMLNDGLADADRNVSITERSNSRGSGLSLIKREELEASDKVDFDGLR